ncbi:MAG: PPC domain-containing protein [Pirellulaceae bacterium]
MRFPHIAGIRRFLAAVLLIGAVSTPTSAEPPHTSYIFPAGGRRGTRVDVRVGGCYLHQEAPLRMTGDGVQASPAVRLAEDTIWFEGPLLYPPESSRKEDYPRDYLGWIAIDADATTGPRHWRVSTSQGVAAARTFIVGDLPEVVEQEIDGDPVPTKVSPPVTINGRIFPRRDIDVWTFRAEARQQVTCSVAAASLGSPLDARIEIRAPGGKVVAESSGRFSLDPQLRFETTTAGLYEVRIHDAAFGGMQDHVYRLTITAGPWLDGVFPLGGRRGETVELQLRGQQLSSTTANLAIPADAADVARLPLSIDGLATSIELETGELREAKEVEPNNQQQQAVLESAPVTLNGRISSPGDVDVWAFDTTKGDKLQFEVHAARLGSPLDSLLIVRNEAGDELARNDDVSGGMPDSRLVFTAKADGRVFVEVSERFAQRGGPAFAYRLHVTPPTSPGFAITAPSDALNIDRGGQQKLQLTLAAESGFNRPIKITVEGLPEGVTAQELTLKKVGGRANLTIDAAETARLGTTPIRIVGVTTDDQPPVTSVAQAATTTGATPPADTVLAVAQPTPFTFAGEYAFSFVRRGSVHYKRYHIERGGYRGPLEVQLADRQVRHLQGVTGPKITVPADADSFDYPIFLPPWMELGRTSRTTLMATGVVTGPDGQNHRVVYSSGVPGDQMICRVSPALLQIAAPSQLAVAPGESTVIPITVKRDAEVRGDVRVELVSPAHVSGVSAEPVILNDGSEQAELIVEFTDAPGPLNMPLLLRATSGQGNSRVVGETEIEPYWAK